MPLSGQVYAITGGSRGFGLAIARVLVDRGARVGLLGRNPDSLEQGVAGLGGECALGIVADVTKKAATGDALAAVKDHFGRLDGLVNNAGMARPNKVENLVEEEVLLQVNTNFLGTVFACQAAIPLLRGGSNPRIVNISSASAHHYDEMSHLSIYAATKTAVERFSRDLANELEPEDIGVTCIRPGAAWTGFAEGWDPDALAAGIEAWRELGTWMNVGMEVEQIGDAVAYALEQPPGVAVDLLEIRPRKRMQKL